VDLRKTTKQNVRLRLPTGRQVYRSRFGVKMVSFRQAANVKCLKPHPIQIFWLPKDRIAPLQWSLAMHTSFKPKSKHLQIREFAPFSFGRRVGDEVKTNAKNNSSKDVCIAKLFQWRGVAQSIPVAHDLIGVRSNRKCHLQRLWPMAMVFSN